MFVFVQVVDGAALVIEPADSDVFGAQHLAQLVADQVDDGLEVEFGRDALLNGVDDRQFGGALLRFLQQPLRLVEQARVLERHAHAGGDGRQQAHLGFAERVFALVVLQDDRAEDTIAAEDRHGDGRAASHPCPA